MKLQRMVLIAGAVMLLFGATFVFADEPTLVVVQPEVAVFGPEQAEFNQALVDVHFDYEDHIIDEPGQEKAMDHNAKYLLAHPDIRFYVDGYTDWRGDILYNLTLSQKRADAVTQGLVKMGVAPERILLTVGWGKLYPTCAEQDESCWKQNRRVRLEYVPSWFTPSKASAGGM